MISAWASFKKDLTCHPIHDNNLLRIHVRDYTAHNQNLSQKFLLSAPYEVAGYSRSYIVHGYIVNQQFSFKNILTKINNFFNFFFCHRTKLNFST